MNIIKRLILYINTIKFLKLSQIYYRIVKIIIPRAKIDPKQEVNFKRFKNWNHIDIHKEKISKNNVALFLNNKTKLELPLDWNNPTRDKLWSFNLNYFEELMSEGSKDKRSHHLELINNWESHKQNLTNTNLEPYPTSLRVVNFLKAFLRGLDLEYATHQNIYYQASFVFHNLEKDILANHYFSNLKALFFAGYIYGEKKWQRFAIKEIFTELDEQILDDGANFELSPMYHVIFMIDLFDILNLCFCLDEEQLPDRFVNKVKEKSQSMLNYYLQIIHGDKQLPNFNDSSNNVAPSYEKILEYSEVLSLKIKAVSNDFELIDLDKSGFYIALLNKSKLIFDVGNIGPDYQPGHAHADTLSFEFSIDGEQIFVNSGTSEYGSTKKREAQRSTRLHSTVEVNNKDSSQVWSSFRVGNRANILERKAELDSDDRTICFSGVHNGYSSFFKKCLHKRKIKVSENSLNIIDEILSSEIEKAISRFYIHPNNRVYIQDNMFCIISKSYVMQADLTNINYEVVDSYYCSGFGNELPNKCLQINIINNKQKINFLYKAKND